MKKILIVDDDTDILNIPKPFLQRKGFEIRISAACDETYGIFHSFLPDLVLLDINVGQRRDGQCVIPLKLMRNMDTRRLYLTDNNNLKAAEIL